MPGPKIDRPSSDSDARISVSASSMVGGLLKPLVNWPKIVEPMPTMTASTSTLTPDETTLPSTFSARKAVRPKRPNGTSTKPASVVSLNSIRLTKSWIAMMKKLMTTISQATSRMAIWTKLSKKLVKPISPEIEVRIGLPASMPTCASLPGCRSCAAVIVPPPASMPRPAKEL